MIDLEQGTIEWHAYRRAHIGSSDIAVIMGLSPWKTVYELWLEKTSKKEEYEPNAAMIRGNTLEPEARRSYIKQTGNLIMPNICVSSKWKIAMASLDGVDETGELIVEIKCPSLDVFNMALKGEVPAHYVAQIQWQLWITEAKEAHYFCYINETLFTQIVVKPDEKYQLELVKKAKEFWELIEKDIPPEVTEKDYVRIDDSEANRIAIEWVRAKDEEKEAQEKRKRLELALLEFTDDGNCIFIHSKVKVTRFYKKGAINIVKFCKTKDIQEEELEVFRKAPFLCTRISFSE